MRPRSYWMLSNDFSMCLCNRRFLLKRLTVFCSLAWLIYDRLYLGLVQPLRDNHCSVIDWSVDRREDSDSWLSDCRLARGVFLQEAEGHEFEPDSDLTVHQTTFNYCFRSCSWVQFSLAESNAKLIIPNRSFRYYFPFVSFFLFKQAETARELLWLLPFQLSGFCLLALSFVFVRGCGFRKFSSHASSIPSAMGYSSIYQRIFVITWLALREVVQLLPFL